MNIEELTQDEAQHLVYLAWDVLRDLAAGVAESDENRFVAGCMAYEPQTNKEYRIFTVMRSWKVPAQFEVLVYQIAWRYVQAADTRPAISTVTDEQWKRAWGAAMDIWDVALGWRPGV